MFWPITQKTKFLERWQRVRLVSVRRGYILGKLYHNCCKEFSEFGNLWFCLWANLDSLKFWFIKNMRNMSHHMIEIYLHPNFTKLVHLFILYIWKIDITPKTTFWARSISERIYQQKTRHGFLKFVYTTWMWDIRRGLLLFLLNIL